MRENVYLCVSGAGGGGRGAGGGARGAGGGGRGAGGGGRGAGSGDGLQCYGTNVYFTLHIG